MDNREFDYSGLYNNGGTPQNGAPQNPNPQAQPGGNAYPNVGSSGMNTANTAPTDYTAPHQGAAQDASGYTSSFGGGNNGGNDGNGGYSYTSAPQQPPKKARKHGGAKKILTRVGAGVCIFALGLGGGIGGAMIASRAGLTGGSVVVQTVDRTASTADAAASQGSTTGTALSVQDVASIVSPSVVVITTEQMVSANTWFGGSYVESGAGSGVIMSQDGYILTCAHVVNGATSIKVQLEGSDDEYDAKVIGADTTADIAVIKIEATGLTPAVMGNSDVLAVGETVVAVGNPLGTLGGTVTNGIVSALNRSIEVNGNQMTLIQTSASISPGNSGGGLFNATGELVGIVNAKSGYSEAEGLGFAIPINTAMEISQELINNGHVTRPGLGVMVVTISDANTAAQYGVTNMGVYISKVNDGSGAAAAGLKAGDRIVSVGDIIVSQSSDVTNYIDTLNIGDTVTIQVERSGKIMSFDVALGERNAS